MIGARPAVPAYHMYVSPTIRSRGLEDLKQTRGERLRAMFNEVVHVLCGAGLVAAIWRLFHLRGHVFHPLVTVTPESLGFFEDDSISDDPGARNREVRHQILGKILR